jgi:hypothetical protein
MVKKLFFIGFAVILAYSVYISMIPYYHYYAFKSDLQEILKVSLADTKEDVMEKIIEIVERYDIPVEKNAIRLFRQKQYVVQVSWQETVDFFTLYQKVFEFHIDTRKQ